MNHTNHSVSICLLGHSGPIGFVPLQICHNWNILINIVTPAHQCVVRMFHECKDVEIILIANGWPENGIQITHYSSTQWGDKDGNKLPNFLTGWPEK